MAVPSSSTSVGSLFSGLSRNSSSAGAKAETTVRTQRSRSASPVSWATIITLRT